MQSSALRYHGTKVVDYGIRALFVLIFVIPLLFFLSMSGGLGSERPEQREKIFGALFFVVVAPAHYTVRLLEMLGVSSDFVAWMVGFVILPLFWGAVTYAVVQLSRRLFLGRSLRA